jgi:transcriptional regulator with XRE-family HTH domain
MTWNTVDWNDPGIRLVLAARDVSALFRILMGHGLSQRRISERVGIAQSEVSEIIRGRHVQSYDVLVRIANGLDVPHSWMGLA